MSPANTSYLCRVLVNQKGYQYVCLPNGIKLPKQVYSVVHQTTEDALKGIAIVEVEVLFDAEYYSFMEGILLFSGDRVPGVRSAIVIPESETVRQPRIKITLKCVAAATQQQPSDLHIFLKR